jgi:hypothetical protein
MVRIIDFQATEPVQRIGQIRPIRIPHSSRNLELATLSIRIPRRDAFRNQVKLTTTVGIRGVSDTSQILFRIFRDGREIFRAQQGIEADLTSEQNYIVTFQAIDMDLSEGSHLYRVTAENITFGAEAAVVGPISFSVFVVDPPEDRDRDFDRGRNRNQSSSREQNRTSSSDDRDRNRNRNRDRSRDRDRDRNRDRVRDNDWDYNIPE